jgi:hypothetical protein
VTPGPQRGDPAAELRDRSVVDRAVGGGDRRRADLGDDDHRASHPIKGRVRPVAVMPGTV